MNKFLNEFREAIKEARILKLIVLVLIGLVLLEFYLVGRLVTNQKIIIIPEGLHKKITLEGNTADPEYIRAMAEKLIFTYYNWGPESVERNYKYLISYFSPELRNQVQTKLLEMAERYKNNNAGQFASIKDLQIKNNEIIVKATVRTFIGETFTSTYESTLKMCYQFNNYSIEITCFEENIEKSDIHEETNNQKDNQPKKQ
ncbi:MAG: type IV conjugative transfer system protein TraE [Sulfurihydrogenibium sp.]|jgi:type IV conjugative transfer system protein TraE|nr:type IV conjugative transfer system protein TraE [Sulfurihydrogenibium sp.]